MTTAEQLARGGNQTRRSVTGEKIFAPAPDLRSRWWRDKKARHTCRVTGKDCEYAFRCAYSLAERHHEGKGRPFRIGSNRDRLNTCVYAIATQFCGLCETCRWHGKECKWSCWFREQFAKSTPPPLSL